MTTRDRVDQIRDESSATLFKYALLIALMSAVTVAIMHAFGAFILDGYSGQQEAFDAIQDYLDSPEEGVDEERLRRGMRWGRGGTTDRGKSTETLD